jgi:hypothetical protein
MVRIHTVLTATFVALVALAAQARHHHARSDQSAFLWTRSPFQLSASPSQHSSLPVMYLGPA